MRDFDFYAPTKVIFGKDKHLLTGETVRSYGFSKIMLQYGKSSVIKSGLLDIIKNSLKENGIEFVECGGVEPNPKLAFVRRAAEIAKKEKVEMILAIGGGSVIDSSKATAIAVKNTADVWDIFMGREKAVSALPVGCVLTLAAAGSEMSASAVITNSDEKLKKGLGTDLNRCLFAICNPELTYSVNKYHTACGVVDIMMHTMERYFTPYPPTPLTDAISEGLLRSVIEAGKILMEDPENYDARATVMWASSLSHNNLTSCGRDRYLAAHQLEHALSGEFDSVAHGAGLALIYPAFAKYLYKYNISRFAQFGRNVFGVKEDDDEKAALSGIEKMKEYFASLGMPQTLSDLGITENCSQKLAKNCTFGGKRTIPSLIELGEKEIAEIFDMMM